MTSFVITFSRRFRNDHFDRRSFVVEQVFTVLLWTAGLSGLAAMAAVLLVIGIGSAPALANVGILAFIAKLDWYPTAGEFGLVPMIAGTAAVSAGALFIAAPLGITCAIYITFYASPATAAFFRIGLQALAGIPSVVYGLWGLTVLVPIIAASRPPGASLLAGIIVLSIMILPTVAVLSQAGLRQISPGIYRGGLALGCCRHSAIVRIVVPSAKNALTAACMLGLARALGETMAVLMVTGNAVNIPHGVFDPVRTLPANIALEMAYAVEIHRSALFVSGLVLMAMVIGLLVVCRNWYERDAN